MVSWFDAHDGSHSRPDTGHRMHTLPANVRDYCSTDHPRTFRQARGFIDLEDDVDTKRAIAFYLAMAVLYIIIVFFFDVLKSNVEILSPYLEVEEGTLLACCSGRVKMDIRVLVSDDVLRTLNLELRRTTWTSHTSGIGFRKG